MKKTILNIATATLVTMSLFSCHKKSEDPTPNNVVTPTPTKKNPVVTTPTDSTKKDSLVVVPKDTILEFISTSKPILTLGNNYEFSLENMVSSNVVWDFTAIMSKDKDFTILRNGKKIAVKSPSSNSVFAGDVDLTITLTSGKRTVTKNITVQIGNGKQVDTYKILTPFFGKPLGGTIENFFINKDGNIKSAVDGNFYTDHNRNGDPDASHATYIINDAGNIYMDVQGVKIEYSLGLSKVNTNKIIFTNTKATNLTYSEEIK